MPLRALVTGASSGIGREIALQLAAQEVSPVLASRNAEKLNDLKVTIEAAHRINAEVIPIDLSLPESADSLFNECEKRGLDIDILINNAGVGMFGESVDQQAGEIERMLILNIVSLTSLSSLFGAKMAAKGSGYILNVGSFAGNQAAPYFASYAASKRYVHDFSLALRKELQPSCVSVTCLVPGFVSTAFDANAGISHHRFLSLSRRGSLPPQKVAQIGLRGMFARKAKVTAGVLNKVLGVVTALIPQRMKSAIIYSGVGWIIR